MIANLEKKEKNVVEFDLIIPVEKFEEGIQRSYIKNSKKYAVPGFRKGKAPRKILERYYGDHIFYEDAIDMVFPEAYLEAIKENNLHPVGDRPEIDIKQIGNGEDLILIVKIITKPEVTLGDYKGIEVEEIKADEITDEDIEKELKKMADQNSRIVTVEDRGIEVGDLAEIDFEGFVDGTPFEGGKAEKYEIEIGSNTFIGDFEQQLVGAKIDERVEVNVAFPDEYFKAELAGKQAQFKVRIDNIKKKELPVIDDEFAQDVSEFDTLEKLKDDISNKLKEHSNHHAKHDTEEKIIEKVVENAIIDDIPETMIDRQIDNMVYDYQLNLSQRGMKLDQYLEMFGIDLETFKKGFAEKALKQVRTQLVIEKIIEVENIEVSDEEVDEELSKMAENYQKTKEEIMEIFNDDDISYIENSILHRKIIELLVNNAKLV